MGNFIFVAQNFHPIKLIKQATLLTAFIVTASFVFAVPRANNYSIGFPVDSSLIRLTTIMQDMLDQITSVIGVNGSFELKEARVLNIEATVSHKKRYILYSPSFITSLNNTTNDKWPVMALLAHEIGHHLNGHTIHRGGSKPKLELEADEFAGFVLYKLGATLQQSQNVMHFIAKKKESKTHPSRDSRLLAIEKGWRKAAISKVVAGVAGSGS